MEIGRRTGGHRRPVGSGDGRQCRFDRGTRLLRRQPVGAVPGFGGGEHLVAARSDGGPVGGAVAADDLFEQSAALQGDDHAVLRLLRRERLHLLYAERRRHEDRQQVDGGAGTPETQRSPVGRLHETPMVRSWHAARGRAGRRRRLRVGELQRHAFGNGLHQQPHLLAHPLPEGRGAEPLRRRHVLHERVCRRRGYDVDGARRAAFDRLREPPSAYRLPHDGHAPQRDLRPRRRAGARQGDGRDHPHVGW